MLLVDLERYEVAMDSRANVDHGLLTCLLSSGRKWVFSRGYKSSIQYQVDILPPQATNEAEYAMGRVTT